MKCEELDWISQPRSLIQKIHASSNESWEAAIQSKFDGNISSFRHEVPWLRSDSPKGTLVRQLIMVQDILDQEFYTKEYVVRSEGKETKRTGKFCDLLDIPEGYEVDWQDNRSVKRDSRLVYYGVPIPGRNSWTLHDVTRNAASEADPSSRIINRVDSAGSGKKRCEEEMDTTEDGQSKRVKSEGENSKEASPDDKIEKCNSRGGFQGLNMVLPSDSGPCCIALIYSEDSSAYKINDIIEVIGIVERLDLPACEEMGDEESARFPPSSLVPRIHAVHVQARSHINPVLPEPAGSLESEVVKKVLLTAQQTRRSLVSLLRECLGGDPLAAEFLLLHMLSHVYSRRDDVMALGKFALNLTKCPTSSPAFVETLSEVMSLVCENSFLFPMTISNFNNLNMIPKKDYSANRLKSGLLQLPKGTQVLLDETVLEPGQLKPNGVENLKSLGNLISWQKLAYDFGFNYNIEFECDAKVLILGEGKSLLPSDVTLPLMPLEDAPDYTGILSELRADTVLLSQIRQYLTVVKQIKYDAVSTALQDKIEADFVSERKSNPDDVTGDTLHRLLVMARLVALSKGHLVLQEQDWHDAKGLERDRIGRIGSADTVS